MFKDWDQDLQVELKRVECGTRVPLCHQRKEMEKKRNNFCRVISSTTLLQNVTFAVIFAVLC
jgi:hypothetical protein